MSRSEQQAPALISHTRLFEDSLAEIQQHLAEGTDAAIIKTARVLRKLLLEGDKLVDLVNREHRMDISYHVQPAIAPQNATSWLTTDIDCSSTATSTATLGIKQFLASQVGSFNGSTITVHNVIEFAAHNLGAVHFKKDDTFPGLIHFHLTSKDSDLSPVVACLRSIGNVTIRALIPLRDRLLDSERFAGGTGWTAILCLEVFDGPADEDRFILDIGTESEKDRFSIYVDSRAELTFRIIDAQGRRTYLRTGNLRQALPPGLPSVILCSFSTVGGETLLSLQTPNWNYATVIRDSSYEAVGSPFHHVIGSDLHGLKHTRMLLYGSVLIGRPLTTDEIEDTAAYFLKNGTEMGLGFLFQGNRFLHSSGHPRFAMAGVPT